MAESIEERMYRLQEAKAALGNGSLRKLTADEKKKARITALKGTADPCSCRLNFLVALRKAILTLFSVEVLQIFSK